MSSRRSQLPGAALEGAKHVPGQAAARLYAYWQDLIRLRHATLDLAKVIRLELRELDDELGAYQTDLLNGLRAS